MKRMRAIDADALEKEGWSLHRTIRVDMNTEEYQTKPLRQVPTIEPERKKGKWEGMWEMVSQHENPPTYIYSCSECRHKSFGFYNYCPNCGAEMLTEGEE